MLAELVPWNGASLLATTHREERRRLNKAIDEVNTLFGRNTLVPAAMGLKRTWSTAFKLKPPCNTTPWSELPKVAT